MNEQSPLKIVAVSTSFPLRSSSNAGIFVLRLYQKLEVKDVEIKVICPADPEPAELNGPSGLTLVPVHYAPAKWRVFAQLPGGVMAGKRKHPHMAAVILPLMLAGMAWQLFWQGRKADVIHANWASCGAIAGMVGKLLRKPVITTFRGSDITRARRGGLDLFFLHQAMKGSKTVVCVSEAMAEEMETLYPHHPCSVRVALNGTDDTFFQIQRKPTQKQVKNLLAAGWLVPIKGYDILLKALSKLTQEERSHYHLRIVGEGPSRALLEAEIKTLGLEGTVELAGACLAAEMPLEYQKADMLIMSSRAEGRPNVVVEAVASGIPVLTTNLPGVRGLVSSGYNGWVVSLEDPKAMAAALRQACNNTTLWKTVSRNAAGPARHRASRWGETADIYAQIFRDAAGR